LANPIINGIPEFIVLTLVEATSLKHV